MGVGQAELAVRHSGRAVLPHRPVHVAQLLKAPRPVLAVLLHRPAALCQLLEAGSSLAAAPLSLPGGGTPTPPGAASLQVRDRRRESS